MLLNILVACTAVAVQAAPSACPRIPNNGCGNQHNIGFDNATASHQVLSGNVTRFYAVNVPNTYNADPSKRWPVIFDYHGNGGTSYEQYMNSAFFNYTQGEEYLVVYPQGYENHWQGPSYAVPGIDDLQFTSDLLAHIQQAYCIDPNRVYASGKSNGAGFVDTLACSDNGDVFAAFAMASAALYTDNSEAGCPKKRAILESHGDLDTTIPYHPDGKNGSGGAIPDIDQWVSWWGERTCGPNALPVDSADLGGFNTTIYSCGYYNQVIEHYQVFELGHCWPSTTGTNYDATRAGAVAAHCLDMVLDFTQVVLNFFAKWNKNNAPTN